MKLQAGDYVNTAGLGIDEREEIVQAFLNAGCTDGDGPSYAWLSWDVIGWKLDDGIYYSDLARSLSELGFIRKLTIDQVLGKEWSGEGLPPVGAVCELSRVPIELKENWVIGDKIKVIAKSKMTDFVACYNERLDSKGEGLSCYSLIPEGYMHPIRAEQERYIDAFKDDTGSGGKVARKAYEAGYRK